MKDIKDQMLEQKAGIAEVRMRLDKMRVPGKKSGIAGASIGSTGAQRQRKAGHIVVWRLDESSLSEGRVAMMAKILTDLLPPELADEWAQPSTSAKREVKVAKVRLSSEHAAARAAF